MLPLSLAEPIFAASLVFILFYAARLLPRAPDRREWTSIALFGLATGLIGVSNGRREVLTTTIASPLALAAVAVPGVLIGVVVLVGGDVRAFGKHARPVAGIAYGFGSGVSLGVSELAIKGIAAVYSSDGLAAAAYASAYPYVAVGMAALGLAQLQIGLQRCRMSIVVTVLTVTAKTDARHRRDDAVQGGVAEPTACCSACGSARSRWRSSPSCCSPARGGAATPTASRWRRPCGRAGAPDQAWPRNASSSHHEARSRVTLACTTNGRSRGPASQSVTGARSSGRRTVTASQPKPRPIAAMSAGGNRTVSSGCPSGPKWWTSAPYASSS